MVSGGRGINIMPKKGMISSPGPATETAQSLTMVASGLFICLVGHNMGIVVL